MFEHIMQPGRIRNLEVKNRMKFGSTTSNFSNHDGTVNDREVAYYVERAKGGVGLLTTGGAYPHPLGKGYIGHLGASDDKFIPGLKKIADAIRENGAKSACQIMHTARYAHVKRYGIADLPTGPSAMKSPLRKFGESRGLTNEEVKEMVKLYGHAARRIKEAGFDAVEMRAHGGYLGASFLSPWSNRRTDEYGGSLENRARFVLEFIQEVRNTVGSDYPLIMRLNAAEFIEGGNTEEDLRKVAQMLEDASIDLLSLTVGWHESRVPVITNEVPPGHWLYLANEMKKVVNIPVAMAYRLSKPELAEKAIAEGVIDYWEMCRPLLSDPYLPKKVAEGRPEDIAPCIACNQGCMDNIFNDKEICCIINPYLGKEADPAYQIKPAEKPKKVFVIGGGPGGMEAARTAAERGHHVTLFEKDSQLGGQLFIAAIPPFKHEINSAREWLVRQVEKSSLEIRTGTEVTAKMIEDEKPDAVIVATGANPLPPDTRWMDRDNVIPFEDVMWERKETGDDVVVIGGERYACETAEILADKGKKVTVVRQGPKMATRVGVVQRARLLTRLREKGVTLITGVKKYEDITNEGLIFIDGEGNKQTIKADTIVFGVGMKAEKKLAQELEGKVPALYKIGDCIRPREITDAVDEGARTGCEV